MIVGDLIDKLVVTSFTGDKGIRILDVSSDSRAVAPGTLFCAVKGNNTSGHHFVDQAVSAGAAAVMTETPLPADPGVGVILVPDIRTAMSLAAFEVHGRPSEEMVMIGLTGTNGKTTTTFILESILQAAGLNPGVIGTVSVRFPGQSQPANLTTPEGPDLHRALKRMLEGRTSHIVMEVSSHALSLSRVAGCRYDLGMFTNLTQDHLDFHGDLESYYQAKKKLFTEYLGGKHLSGGPAAVINVDDEWGRRLVDEIGPLKKVTYSLNGTADVMALHKETSRSGIMAGLKTPVGSFEVRSPLLGEINLYNMVAATAAGLALDLSPETIVKGLAAVAGVPGRLQRVGTLNDFLVLVDFAHTPDALTRVLTAVRELRPKRLITVFGCGGDRDRTKRPLMGVAAGRLSHLAIVTSDNPRTEDPLAIIADIEGGISLLDLKPLDPETIDGSYQPGSYVVVPDRRAAINLGVRLLGPGDILVLAGKGHEDYQILGREKIHFDDAEEAEAALTREGKF